MKQKEVSPSPPRDPEIFREEKQKTQEEVLFKYGGLQNIKSRYMETTSVEPVQQQGPPPPKAIPRLEEPESKSPSVSPPRDPEVIRSDEPRDDTEELPPQNITRGLLAKFRQMESDSGKQPIRTTPAPRTDLIEADKQLMDRQPESGQFENEPSYRGDVVREDDDNESAHLPPSGNLKGRLALFKQIEDTGAQPSSTQNYGNQYRSPGRVNGNPGNQQPAGEVVREGDPTQTEELPPPGAAKNIREKFQTMQQDDQAQAQPKAPHEFTPERESPHRQLEDDASDEIERDPNVVRSDVPMREAYYPSKKILKSCLSQFRELEEQAKKDAGVQSAKPVEYGFVYDGTSVPSTEPSQQVRTVRSGPPSSSDKNIYNPSMPEGGEFENEPIVRTDVIRESDNFEEVELPRQGQAKKLLEKYKAKAQTE